MPAVLNDPIVRYFAIPFVATLILAGLIRWVGAGNRGEQTTGAALGIVFAWTSAYELGAILFPPSGDDNNMFYMIAAGLLIGVPIDFLRTKIERNMPRLDLGIAIFFGLGAVYSLRIAFDIWTLVLLGAWVTVVARLYVVAKDASPVASAMLALAAAGLGAAAWAAGLETTLAFQLAAAAAGYFVLNWINPTMRFGMTLMLTGAGALLVTGVRLAMSTHAMVPALLILGFIFFSDAPVRKLLADRKGRRRWLIPVLAAVASLLPSVLAALAAHVGVNFEAS